MPGESRWFGSVLASPSKIDFHRHPLHDFHEIPGRVFRWNHAEARTRAGLDRLHRAVKFMFGIGIHRIVTGWPGCMSVNCVSLKFAITQTSDGTNTNIWLEEVTYMPGSTFLFVIRPSAGGYDWAIAQVHLGLPRIRLRLL